MYNLVCSDRLPTTYGTNGSCTELRNWTCSDWANTNLCDELWATSMCGTNADGLVKDLCKASCGLCFGNVIVCV